MSSAGGKKGRSLVRFARSYRADPDSPPGEISFRPKLIDLPQDPMPRPGLVLL